MKADPMTEEPTSEEIREARALWEDISIGQADAYTLACALRNARLGVEGRAKAVAEELDAFGSQRDRDNEDDDEAQAASAAAYLRSAALIRAALGSEGTTR